MSECDTFESMNGNCGNNMGAMMRFVYEHQSALTTVTVVDGVVTAAVHNTIFKEITFRKGQGQFTDASAIDLVNESTLIPVTVAINLKKRTGEKSEILRKMLDGQPYIAGFAQDGNGIWWYFPNLQVSTMGGGSGETRAAGSNYDTQLMNEEGILAYSVDPTVIADILAAP